MNKLVKQLLHLSQLESGGLQIEKVDFNLATLVDQMIKKNTLNFEEKGIRMNFHAPKDIIVNADVERIEQVLNNYISNALHHVDEKKQIRMRL